MFIMIGTKDSMKESRLKTLKLPEKLRFSKAGTIPRAFLKAACPFFSRGSSFFRYA